MPPLPSPTAAAILEGCGLNGALPSPSPPPNAQVADRLERAVTACLDAGLRTGDIMQPGCKQVGRGGVLCGWAGWLQGLGWSAGRSLVTQAALAGLCALLVGLPPAPFGRADWRPAVAGCAAGPCMPLCG